MKNLATMIAIIVIIATFAAAACLTANAQNPYLPMWEYIPDGEPYVFEDPDWPGKYRVYVYGSHDNIVSEYCGRDQVVWSAPVDDLDAWRYDGIIFVSRTDSEGRPLPVSLGQNEKGYDLGDILYAPDIAVKPGPDGKPLYYLYPNNQAQGRKSMVAVSDRPDGPFRVCNWNPENPLLTDGVLGFDPAVLVDDDGRVYGYWGINTSYCAELDPETMATVKPGTEVIVDMVSSARQKGVFRFFEASSIRKIEDKYVFIYSRTTASGEFGLPSSNYTLAYAYSDAPLGPWTYGGTIIDARARDVDEDGKVIPTANPHGNTHGGIQLIGDNWWVFYHRQTGTDEYSRQAMVAPIDVKVEKGSGGRVIISEAEYTSEGFHTEGLDPLRKTPAGWACYLTNPKGVVRDFPHFRFTGSYIQPTRQYESDLYQGPYNQKQPYCPVVNNTSGSIVGYKYFNFKALSKSSNARLIVHMKPSGIAGKIDVLIGGPKPGLGGRVIGTIDLGTLPTSGGLVEVEVGLGDAFKGVKGKQPLFFSFSSQSEYESLCSLYDFQFFAD